jgi:hypothetical protein
MSAPGQKDKFTPELRILVASLLSFGVIILWAKFFGPKPPVQPPQSGDCSRRAGSGDGSGGESITSFGDAGGDGTGDGGKRYGEKRFAGTRDRRRKQSLPCGNFEPRRGGEELAAEEL